MATCAMSRSFNFLRLTCFNNVMPRLLTTRKVTENILNNLELSRRTCVSSRFKDPLQEEERKKKHKTVRIPQITLLSPDKTMTVTTLENANKIAKSRNLELNKVSDIDNKTNRATYELVDISTYAEDEQQNSAEPLQKLRQKSNKKLFVIHSKITEHDLQIKVKHINKLVSKGDKVQIILTRERNSWESVLQTLKSSVDGQIAVSTKSNKIVLQIKSLTTDSKLPSAKSKTKLEEEIESEP